MTPLRVEGAIVARANGTLAIALLANLPPPFNHVSTCIGIMECASGVAEQICRQVGSALKEDKGQ